MIHSSHPSSAPGAPMPASFLFVCVYARLASTSALILLLLLLQSFGFSVCGLKASVLFAWLLPSLVVGAVPLTNFLVV